jgi:hypothetical protein
MFKILTAGLVFISMSSTWAMDGIDLNVNLSVKHIVRSKLWYEGINNSSKLAGQQNKFSTNGELQYPEELSVVLDKYDTN